MVGRMVSHYRVLAPLGSGGIGIVYRAEGSGQAGSPQAGAGQALPFISMELLEGQALMTRVKREWEAFEV